MKNNKLKSILMSLALLIGSGLMAQDAPPVAVEEIVVNGFGQPVQDLSKLPKMQRDIEILKNVLRDLFYGEDNFFGARNTEGIHIDGKGVMFSMTAQGAYGNILVARDVMVIDGEKGEPEDKKDIATLNQEAEDMIRKNSQEFLLNYASLLSELSADEMVLLNVDYTALKERKKGTYVAAQTVYVSGSGRGNKRMVSSISAKDIEAYMDGKLDETAAKAKIQTQVIEKGDKEKPDAKILAGIFDNLFNSMGDGKFNRRGRTTYTYFDGFGLMYNLKFSSNTNRNVVFATTSGTLIQSEGNLKQAKERDDYYKALEEAYPEFEQQLKQNILEYGRTLRSVKANEVVIVNIDLGTTYRKSKVPRSLQLVIPKSLINDYAKGNKSLEKAASEIDVKKLRTSVASTSGTLWSVPEPTAPAVAVGYVERAQGQN